MMALGMHHHGADVLMDVDTHDAVEDDEPPSFALANEVRMAEEEEEEERAASDRAAANDDPEADFGDFFPVVAENVEEEEEGRGADSAHPQTLPHHPQRHVDPMGGGGAYVVAVPPAPQVVLSPPPHLDLYEQRCAVASERWREHAKWCDRQCEAQRLSLRDRRAALHILVSEARARDVAAARARACAGAAASPSDGNTSSGNMSGSASFNDLTDEAAPTTAESPHSGVGGSSGSGGLFGDWDPVQDVRRAWRDVARRVAEDMAACDNSATVLKNLSCMCVFIEGSVCRSYGENVEARQRRLESMREGLRQLQARGKLFHDALDEGAQAMR